MIAIERAPLRRVPSVEKLAAGNSGLPPSPVSPLLLAAYQELTVDGVEAGERFLRDFSFVVDVVFGASRLGLALLIVLKDGISFEFFQKGFVLF